MERKIVLKIDELMTSTSKVLSLKEIFNHQIVINSSVSILLSSIFVITFIFDDKMMTT